LGEEVVLMTNVTLVYPNGKKPLVNASMNIHGRSFNLIVGESGSGKTSLLRLLAGLIPWIYHARVNGVVRVLGLNPLDEVDVTRLPPLIGYAPQSTSYAFTQLHVKEELLNRQYFLEEQGIEIRLGVDDVVYMLGLKSVLGYRIEWLSGGFRRKLLLARSLIGPPSLVLLDEPLGDLDNSTRKAVKEVLLDVRRYSTILVAEHNASELIELIDKIIVINNGVLIELDHRDSKPLILSGDSLC